MLDSIAEPVNTGAAGSTRGGSDRHQPTSPLCEPAGRRRALPRTRGSAKMPALADTCDDVTHCHRLSRRHPRVQHLQQQLHQHLRSWTPGVAGCRQPALTPAGTPSMLRQLAVSKSYFNQRTSPDEGAVPLPGGETGRATGAPAVSLPIGPNRTPDRRELEPTRRALVDCGCCSERAGSCGA